MIRRFALLIGLVVGSLVSAAPALAQSVTPCQFVLGFATLHSLDPVDTGNCLDNQVFAANGDAQQRTSNGLMAWRKADNWTAFTNGYWTWINGPYGLAKRLNTQRYSWEANPDGLPLADAATAAPTAPAASTGCVATVDASVKYPQLGGGTQTVFVTADDANGNPVGGATGDAYVQYSTTSRDIPLTATDGSGATATSWSVGGPKGTVTITVTEHAGGCAATGSTSFQGRS